MTASALRPWRSKCSRWRSPLPLLLGPGTTETQLGSHSAMRLGSAMRSKTSWMETPTVPVYVNETGRMGDNMAVRGGEEGKGGESGERGDKGGAGGGRGGGWPAGSLRPIAAFLRPCRP